VITTIVLVRADPQRIPETARALAGIEGVHEVYSVSGEWDLVVIVKVPEYQDIAEVVTEKFPAVIRHRASGTGGGAGALAAGFEPCGT
jgi:DNA-binding Lrp family transcriptional regulator